MTGVGTGEKDGSRELRDRWPGTSHNHGILKHEKGFASEVGKQTREVNTARGEGRTREGRASGTQLRAMSFVQGELGSP